MREKAVSKLKIDIFMENYQKITSDLIKSHMEMMGPNVAMSIAQKISGLKITVTGEILDGSKCDKETFEQLRDAYHHFAGSLSEMITKTVLDKHPELRHTI